MHVRELYPSCRGLKRPGNRSVTALPRHHTPHIQDWAGGWCFSHGANLANDCVRELCHGSDPCSLHDYLSVVGSRLEVHPKWALMPDHCFAVVEDKELQLQLPTALAECLLAGGLGVGSGLGSVLQGCSRHEAVEARPARLEDSVRVGAEVVLAARVWAPDSRGESFVVRRQASEGYRDVRKAVVGRLGWSVLGVSTAAVPNMADRYLLVVL